MTAASGCSADPSATRATGARGQPTARPRRLAGTANIGLVAPSGSLTETATAIENAVAYFESLGHHVFQDDTLRSSWRYFSATDETRLASFHRMVADPRIDIIMAARGGYGLSRIIADFDYPAIARSGKLFVGFSDFTIFHLAALARCGMVTLAGPMAAVDFCHTTRSTFTEDRFWSLVRSSVCSTGEIACSHRYPAQTVEGVIWGGNLSLVVHLLGTAYFPAIEGGILFIEEVNEDPYRIERMFLQLLHSGVLPSQRALLIGELSGCEPTARSRAPYTVDDVLDTLRARLAMPVLSGLPFGHIKDKITIPVGARAALQVEPYRYSIEFSDYNQ
jgi:muramoyltetrapeptide carboxypeptidase